MQNPVIIGRFGRTYGIKGWLRVEIYADINDPITHQPWQIQQNNNWKVLDITDHKMHSNSLLVHIKGIDTPEEAKALLVGKTIALNQEQLPQLAENEFYWSDLEGLQVITTQGQNLGTVDYLLESKANDVLVVQGERERLIPYIPEQVIIKVDLEAKQIIVDWDPDF